MIVASLGYAGLGQLGDGCTANECVEMENVFQRLKAAATAAQWPPQYSPLVVQIDQAWQSLKQSSSPNLAFVEQLRTAAESLIQQINAFRMGKGQPPPKPGAKPTTPGSFSFSSQPKPKPAPTALVPTVAPSTRTLAPSPAAVLMPSAPPPPDNSWMLWGAVGLTVLAVGGGLLFRNRRATTMVSGARRSRRFR